MAGRAGAPEAQPAPPTPGPLRAAVPTLPSTLGADGHREAVHRAWRPRSSSKVPRSWAFGAARATPNVQDLAWSAATGPRAVRVRDQPVEQGGVARQREVVDAGVVDQ